MENPFRPIVEHVKEKAPAYALAAVVAIGSLALMGEGDGEHPGKIGNGTEPDYGASVPTAVPFEHADDTFAR